MWSENRKVDICINILLFLLSMNFMRYGQIFVPIICLILFVDNKFKFKINNIKVFAVLVLFSITFFAFSYKLGIYGIVGFFFPMAYYIGSNMKNVSKENIIKLFYVMAFGMAVHLILNFGYDFTKYGILLFRKNNHYDIWTGTIVQQATTASYCLFITACFYYLINYESNRFCKTIGLILFVIVSIYNIGLGRRTPLFVTIISYVISYIADTFIYKNKVINIEVLKKVFVGALIIIVMFLALFYANIFGIKRIITSLSIYQKFLIHGLSSGRIELFIESLPLMPKYLWGGQNISNVLEIQVHNMWIDTYDYAGIIPFILICIYTIMYSATSFKIYKNRKIETKLKIVLLEKDFVCLFLMMAEPAITGLSIFIICLIIQEACLEKLSND